MRMACQYAVADYQERCAEPVIRTIGAPEVCDLSAKDLADFNEKPGHLTFLTPIYRFVVLGLARLTFGYFMPPLLSSPAPWFALLGSGCAPSSKGEGR
jgi:uncharacterized membrane protein